MNDRSRAKVVAHVLPMLHVIPDEQGTGDADQIFHLADGWKAAVFYDGGAVDYLDHLICPDGGVIDFWDDWPDGPERDALINWRGN